jgi:single-strand DNA-binding protein
VVVHGRFRTRQWEKEGRTTVEPEIDAVAVGHDLSRGASVFRPVRRTAAAAAPEAVPDAAPAAAPRPAGGSAAA